MNKGFSTTIFARRRFKKGVSSNANKCVIIIHPHGWVICRCNISFNTQADITLAHFLISTSLKDFVLYQKQHWYPSLSTLGCSAPQILTQAFPRRAVSHQHAGLSFSPWASWFDYTLLPLTSHHLLLSFISFVMLSAQTHTRTVKYVANIYRDLAE